MNTKTALKLANSAAAGAWMSKEMAVMAPVLDVEFEVQQQDRAGGWFEGLRMSGVDVFQVDAIKIKAAGLHLSPSNFHAFLSSIL